MLHNPRYEDWRPYRASEEDPKGLIPEGMKMIPTRYGCTHLAQKNNLTETRSDRKSFRLNKIAITNNSSNEITMTNVIIK